MTLTGQAKTFLYKNTAGLFTKTDATTAQLKIEYATLRLKLTKAFILQADQK
jgi:hypothetical protein